MLRVGEAAPGARATAKAAAAPASGGPGSRRSRQQKNAASDCSSRARGTVRSQQLRQEEDERVDDTGESSHAAAAGARK